MGGNSDGAALAAPLLAGKVNRGYNPPVHLH